MKEYDVIIIGGGIMGCSTAYYLSKLGVKPLVLEKNPDVGLEASGRCACGVRQQNRKGALRLSMASVNLWKSLSEELSADLEYVQTGNLKVVWNSELVGKLEEDIAWEHEQGLSEVRMVTATECLEMVPGITGKILAGKFCSTDGIANPMLVTKAFKKAASRLGAQFKTKSKVTRLLRSEQTVHGVVIETSTGEVEIKSDEVVNTTGPWAEALNRLAGCHTPISPGLDTLMITDRQPRRFTPFVGFGWWGYILQPKSGNIIIGLEDQPNEKFGKHVIFEEVTQRTREMCEILPWLKKAKFLRSFSGITEYTPDREPYIGRITGINGFMTASGFSGQGFCLGPITGKLMAGLITGNPLDLSLAAFNPQRFSSLGKSIGYL